MIYLIEQQAWALFGSRKKPEILGITTDTFLFFQNRKVYNMFVRTWGIDFKTIVD